MGLDIVVRRPIKLNNTPTMEYIDTNRLRLHVIDEEPELEVFRDFIFDMDVSYYDYDPVINPLGYKLDELTWRATFSLDSYGDLIEYANNEKILANRNFKNPITENQFNDLLSSSEYGFTSVEEFTVNETDFILLFNIPTVYKSKKCLVTKEVGHQRKGANKKFYSDDMWDSPSVKTLDELTKHWESYFSDNKENKRNFKENIIDKFIEGETFVDYC